MRSTTWPAGVCALAAAALVLLGCSAPPPGVAGAETDPPTTSGQQSGPPADPDDQETASAGGSGGGSARLVKLPAGGGGTIEIVDGEGCAALGGSSTEAAVTVTIAEVLLAPDGTTLLPGPCGGGSTACAGLVWTDSFGGCSIRFAPAPGATTLDADLLGTVACADPAECAKAYAIWESSGDPVLHWELAFPEPDPSESASVPDGTGGTEDAPTPDPAASEPGVGG
jgi:hypothetical protein